MNAHKQICSFPEAKSADGSSFGSKRICSTLLMFLTLLLQYSLAIIEKRTPAVAARVFVYK